MNSGDDREKILERKDFESIAKKALDEVIASPPPAAEVMNYAIRLSSGTTGNSLLVGLHKTSDLMYRAHLTKEWYSGASRTLCCYGPVSLRTFTVLDAQKSGDESALCLSVDVGDLGPHIGGLLSDFAPQKILGIPSYVIHVASHMDAKTRDAVRSVNVYGELLTKAFQTMITDLFPNAVSRSLYAISELGAVSTVSCTYQPSNYYHPRPGVEVEVFEPDEAGAGDLVVTTLLNQTIPITRYRTGDMGRMVHAAQCPCGASSTFEILGRRGYDYIKLVGVTLRQEECDRVATALRAYDDYRIEASNVAEGSRLKGAITLHVFLKGGVGTDELAQEIGERFSRELSLTPTRSLADLVAEGLFAPVSVRFSPKPFPQNNKNIKLTERTSAL